MKKRALCWLLALLMTAALFAFVALCCDVRFAVNDDSGILRAFLGYETGTPASFHIYIHGLLAKPLYWLSCAFPGVMWYSWMQLALLFLAQTVISKSIMQCFVKHEKPLWLGAVFAAAQTAQGMSAMIGCDANGEFEIPFARVPGHHWGTGDLFTGLMMDGILAEKRLEEAAREAGEHVAKQLRGEEKSLLPEQ